MSLFFSFNPRQVYPKYVYVMRFTPQSLKQFFCLLFSSRLFTCFTLTLREVVGSNTSMNAYLTSKLYTGMRDRQVLRDVSTAYCRLTDILFSAKTASTNTKKLLLLPRRGHSWFTLVVERGYTLLLAPQELSPHTNSVPIL